MLCAIFLNFSFFIDAKIIESNQIADVINYLDPSIAPKDVVIVFDIDNTIAEPTNQMSSPQWFSAMIRKKMKIAGITKTEAVDALLPLYSAVMEYTQMQPVENITVNFIRLLQNAGYKVMSLTARSPQTLAKRTLTQLRDLNIDFTKSKLYRKNIKFSDGVQYIDNIIFADGGNKGELLFEFFEKIKYQPKLVVFVDDKDYNCYNIEGTLQQHGINHVCLRYGARDAKYNAFNLAMTEDILLSLRKIDPKIDAAYRQFLPEAEIKKNEPAAKHIPAYN